MKKTIDTILRYLNHDDEEILSLRDSILELDVSRPDEIENALEHILNAIDQVNFDNQDYLGYYHFFLDCLYYEKGEYIKVIKSLQVTISQLWKTQTNKALAYWLLGISYSHLNEDFKARVALKEALNILSTNRHINTLSEQKHYDQRSPIRERINKALVNLQASAPPHLQELSAEIISQLQIPEGDFNLYWKDWQKSIYTMPSDPYHISDQINLLMRMPLDVSTGIPFINIFLAHCYNLDFFSGNKGSLTPAIKYAEDAITKFNGDKLNQALAHWYVALLYFNLPNTEVCQFHLKKSDYLLTPIPESTKYTSTDFYNNMQNTRNSLWALINKSNHTNKSFHYVEPETPPYASQEKSSFWSRKKGNEKHAESGATPKLTENKSNIRHIIVPVDINALEDQQSKAIPLDHKLFDKLESYNHLDSDSLNPPEIPV